jgi:pyridoxine kinase
LNILSIQSHVAYGHVGNSAVVLPLQRLGHEVWPVHTAMLSNHAGYPDHGGRAVPAAELADVIEALDRRGALARCNGVLSGYLGDAAAGDVVLDAVARVRKFDNSALYCCDPVLGDDGEIYVAAGIVPFMRDRAAPAADVLTPNLFELAVLTDTSSDSLAAAPLGEIIATAKKLITPDRRTSKVLVTSLTPAGLPPTDLAMAAVTDTGAWLVTTPKLSFATPPHGAGDCCAALFCVALLGGDAASALSQTASAIYALLHATARLGRHELALVEAQDFLVDPPEIFRVEALS